MTIPRFYKIVARVLSLGLAGFFLLFAHMLDDWIGILAYPLRFTLATVGLACVLALPWFDRGARTGTVVTGLLIAAFLSLYALPTPSARLLRSALIDVPLGAEEHEVRNAIKDAYAGSPYVLPQIEGEPDRIHVSLLNQEPGDCTGLIFCMEEGRVVAKSFSPD